MIINHRKLQQLIAEDRLRATIAETRSHWANRILELATAAYMAEDYTRASELVVRALALDPAMYKRCAAASQRITDKAREAGQKTAHRLKLASQTRCRQMMIGEDVTDEAVEELLAVR